MTVSYDSVANAYNRRYELQDFPGIRSAILSVVASSDNRRVLEVGCGTCNWLALLARSGSEVAGIDPSKQMLLRGHAVSGDIREGVAEDLPWADASFDVVFYINALQHFQEPERALCEAARVLRPGGTLLSIGLDPHEKRDRWCVYDFFPETLELDLKRFPSLARRSAWLEMAGFSGVTTRVVEVLQSSRSLDELLRDGVLEQSYTSQLTALSPHQYAAGMRRVRQAADRDQAFRFVSELTLYATQAHKAVAPVPV